MTVGQVTARTRVLAADHNSLVNLLQGASNETLAFLLRVAASNNFTIVLSDNAGTRKFSIKDSDEVEIFAVDSNGNITNSGSYAPTGLVLPGEASPSTTTAGSLRRDTDDHVIGMGTGSAYKRLSPFVGAGATAAVAGEIVHDTTRGATYIHNGTAEIPIYSSMSKAKTSAQNIVATTTYAAVTATSGNMEFTAQANTLYVVDFWIDLTATSGGIKFKTNHAQTTSLYWALVGFPDSGSGATLYQTPITTAGNDILSVAAASITARPIHLRVEFTQGATAGLVTFHVAQNTASGTATINNGRMEVRSVVAAT